MDWESSQYGGRHYYCVFGTWAQEMLTGTVTQSGFISGVNNHEFRRFNRKMLQSFSIEFFFILICF